MYQGTPYAMEPDPNARMVFIASMTHAHELKPNLDAMRRCHCPNDALDRDRRDEVVHHEEILVNLNRRSPWKTRSRRSPSKQTVYCSDPEDSGCEYWDSERTMACVDTQGH